MTQDELAQMWQEQGSEPSTEDDFSWAPRTWRRRRRKRRLGLVGEVLGGTGAIGVAVWFLIQSPTAVTGALLAIVTLVVLLSFGANLRMVLAMSRAASARTSSYVARLLDEAEIELRAQQWMTRIVWFSALLIFPWAAFTVWHRLDVYLAEPWRGALGVGGIVVIFAGLNWQLHQAKEKLEDEIERLRVWSDGFEEEP